MTFTVTYRGKDGAKCEETVEAASRSDCVAECRRRGIAPTAIREGRSGKSAASPNGRARSASARLVRIVIALVVVILVVAGVWWWLASHSGRGVPTQPAQPVNVQKRVPPVKKVDAQERVPPVKKVVPTVKTNEVHEASLPPWNDSFMTNREMKLKYSTLIQATTNEGGLVIERYRLPNGKTWRKMIDPPPLFRNVSDQAIAMTVGGAAGGPIPPVPGLNDANLDAEFLKSLEVPITIEANDSPRAVALKMAVKETRDEIVRLKADGDKRTVGQMLSDHILANNRNASMQADALAEVKRVRETEGEEFAKKYLEAVNAHLKSYGIRPIRLGKARTGSPVRDEIK